MEERPELIAAESPGHRYACWYPVGSPEYHERRERLEAAATSEVVA
jgi:hypothetical protein